VARVVGVPPPTGTEYTVPFVVTTTLEPTTASPLAA
jgi:hypothetical protein